MEKGCGVARRSGKSTARLRIKEIVAFTKLMRVVIIHLYKLLKQR